MASLSFWRMTASRWACSMAMETRSCTFASQNMRGNTQRADGSPIIETRKSGVPI